MENKNEVKKEDKTYIETIQTDEFIVGVYVCNTPRTEEKINRSMEKLIRSRYRHKFW